MNQPQVSRRNVLASSLAGAGLLLAGSQSITGCAATGPQGISSMKPKSSDFYDSKGNFQADKAKQAYYDLMKRFNYPISDALRSDQLWVCDFLQRDFASLGMGGIFFSNAKGVYGKSGAGDYKGEFKDQSFGYLGHDIYLLPGQTLPEHFHIGGPEGYGPKMESWLVRHGEIHLFGEYKGAGDEVPISDLPKSDRPWGYGESWFKCKYAAHRTARSGQMYSLVDPESRHFMRAGSRGAIVSEFATYHNHVDFTKPGMKFDNSKAS